MQAARLQHAVAHGRRAGLQAIATDLSIKAAMWSGLNDFVSDSIFSFPRVPTFVRHQQIGNELRIRFDKELWPKTFPTSPASTMHSATDNAAASESLLPISATISSKSGRARFLMAWSMPTTNTEGRSLEAGIRHWHARTNRSALNVFEWLQKPSLLVPL